MYLVRKLTAAIFLFAALSTQAASQSPAQIKPANPQASVEATAILAYIADLPHHKTQRIISGQFESWGQDVKPLNDSQNWLNKTYQATGKWVGLMGIEYHTQGVWPENPNRAAVEFWQQGGLIQLYLIMSNPANPGANNGGGKCDIDLVLQPGHAYNKHFFAELDQVAVGLQELQQKHVVVFINMFAEMTADWFWWGGQRPEKFKRLYQASFDYLTKRKGLNNLLFVFEPSAFHKTALDYYPGDKLVDMTGISIFVDNNEPLTRAKLPMYSALVNLGKPIAFSQWGPRRGSDQTGKLDQPPADNMKLLQAIKSDFPDIVWWMNWSQAYALASDTNSNLNAGVLLKDPWVINRDQLQWRNFLSKH